MIGWDSWIYMAVAVTLLQEYFLMDRSCVAGVKVEGMIRRWTGILKMRISGTGVEGWEMGILEVDEMQPLSRE